MINYEALYNQAMAHNAMLREALILQTEVISSYDVMERSIKALNATGPDVEAWERKLREQVMLAVHPLQPEYEKLQQQLATVTAERDALLEGIRQAYDLAICEGMGGCVPYLCKLLAQKGGE